MSFDMVTLIVLCVAWSAGAVSLAVGWMLRTQARTLGGRWFSAGMLVMMSAGILSRLSDILRWPHELQLLIDGPALVAGLIGMGCVLMGAVKGQSERSGSRSAVER
jgi:hypothetical protein